MHVSICTKSKYFENACKPGFAVSRSEQSHRTHGSDKFQEAARGYIELEEDSSTVMIILAELYGIGKAAIGSTFTDFALATNIHKEKTMGVLVRAFVAADKVSRPGISLIVRIILNLQYDLETVKCRVAATFIDRLPLLHDPLVLLDLAGFIFDNCPERDCGLREVMVRTIQARLPEILTNNAAKEELVSDRFVLMAVLDGFAGLVKSGDLAIAMSPVPLLRVRRDPQDSPGSPVTPTKRRKL